MRSLAPIVLALLAATALVLALPTPEPDAASTGFAVVGVRVFDGREFRDSVDVLVRDGRIAAVGPALDLPDDLASIDGRGQTLLPGLIDAHVHTFGQAQSDALRFGVTTLLDMFTAPTMLPEARRQRERIDQAAPADLYSAGMLATAGGGHGTQFGVPVTPIEQPDQAQAWVDARLAEGSDFIKIVIEPGRLWSRSLPTLDAATVQALVSAAHTRGVLAVAHVSTEADAIMALDAGVDGLVHVFADQPASEAFLDLARERGVFVVPTTVVMAGIGAQLDHDALLAEPNFSERLSTEQRQSLHQAGWGALNGEALLGRSLANVTALHEAGIPLLAGSDAPNPGTAHGLSLHQELELMVTAGLSPTEALATATTGPADAFGLTGRGCLVPGCRADLVLIDGDPQNDIRATRRIEAVWKNGHAVALDLEPSRPAAAAPTDSDLLGAQQIGRWIAADDRFLGGGSQADIRIVAGGRLEVGGELSAGSQFPYAGVMWSGGAPFMSPVDLAERERLVIGLRGERGPWLVMLFSGAAPGAAQPQQVPLEETAEGAELVLKLEELPGVDFSQFQALGVFAVGDPGEFDFELIEARLE